MSRSHNPFGARASITTPSGDLSLYRLDSLEREADARLDGMPMTVKIFLENLLRMVAAGFASEDMVSSLAMWGQKPIEDRELPYAPARVILQDFTGVPAVVDLAAMRSAIEREGGDPAKVDPLVPVDLVIDHSVQVDAFGTATAFATNVEREYERNHERYSLLRWAQGAFNGFRVVPPGLGIVHQVNLEYLATVVRIVTEESGEVAVPDTLVGTDSHTTMINGLGVLGWGVGGIEAEAALLGQPLPLITPKVVGFRFSGALPMGITATDLVLTVTEILRKHGVVGKFVEFYGEGLSSLSVADRATLGNMSPEYGATAAYFPVDDQTLEYLKLTGRPEEVIRLAEQYTKEQGLFRTDHSPDPEFNETLELDLASVEPSVAGPKRPQDRVALPDVWASFADAYRDAEGDPHEVEVSMEPLQDTGEAAESVRIRHGSVVIAAITSCTNTSNASVMLGAGLLAQKALDAGLRTKPWVKTSMAPGSRVVTEYLQSSGLIEPLERLGFHVVGYGCTTCIGNSGPLPQPISEAIDEHDLAVVSVLSGNRNFEGRIHPQV
ncbi:MAG: aconitate hydratase AcnA, partial [Actinobacteria bacterium]|nr:aconitate hydratase AcnA [Actinomycetota bacterium]